MTEEEAAGSGHNRPAWIGAWALVAAALIAGMFALLDNRESPSERDRNSAHGGESRNENTCVAGGVVVRGDVHCTQENGRKAPGVRPATADAGCGLLRNPRGGVSFRLRVLMWCAPKSVRGQYEYVLKIAIDNTGKTPVDISADRFLLLWRKLRGNWTPPPGGGYGEPREVRYLGREYWAIPANIVGAAEYREDGALTFATEWTHTTLDPGESSLRLTRDSARLRYADHGVLKTIRYNRDEDDLVFYVPELTVNRDLNFLGLAYVKGNRVIALCPQDRWGPKVSPIYF